VLELVEGGAVAQAFLAQRLEERGLLPQQLLLVHREALQGLGVGAVHLEAAHALGRRPPQPGPERDAEGDPAQRPGRAPAHRLGRHHRLGQRRAHHQPTEQPAQVGGVVDTGDGEACKQRITDEAQRPRAHLAEDLVGHRAALEHQIGQQRAIDAEDRPRGAHAHRPRLPPQAGQVAQQPGHQVEHCETGTAIQALDHLPGLVQGPHVEAHVEQPAVQEERREEAPRLVLLDQRCEVSAHPDQQIGGSASGSCTGGRAARRSTHWRPPGRV
jgi:hypothetical protein